MHFAVRTVLLLAPKQRLDPVAIRADTALTMLDDLVARSELVAVLILVLGAIAARVASVAAGAFLGFLDRRTSRIATTDKSLVSPRLIKISRAIVFWLVIVLAISYALRVLGVGGLSAMLSAVIDFVPQLLVGLTIIVIGHIVGLVASHVVANMSDDITITSLGPRLVRGAIVVIAIVMGLQHINVDISFVTQLMLIAIAILGGGLMLAFAIGARQHVANLLARRELSRLAVGERIRVDGIDGEIVDIHSTGLDISTSEGVVSIPAARLAETHVLRHAEADQGG